MVADKSPFFVVVTTRGLPADGQATAPASFRVALQYRTTTGWDNYVDESGVSEFVVASDSPAFIRVRPFFQTQTDTRWAQLPTGRNYSSTADVWGLNTHVTTAGNATSRMTEANGIVANGNDAGVFRLVPIDADAATASPFSVVVFSAFGWKSGTEDNTDGFMNNDAFRVLPRNSLATKYVVPADSPARFDSGQFSKTMLGTPAEPRVNDNHYHIAVVPTANTYINAEDRDGQLLFPSPVLVPAGSSLQIIGSDTRPFPEGYGNRSLLSGLVVKSFNSSVLPFDGAPGAPFAVFTFEESVDSGEGLDWNLSPASTGTDPGYTQILPLAADDGSINTFDFIYIPPPAMRSTNLIYSWTYDSRAVAANETPAILYQPVPWVCGWYNLLNQPTSDHFHMPTWEIPGGWQHYEFGDPLCGTHSNPLAYQQYVDVYSSTAWGLRYDRTTGTYPGAIFGDLEEFRTDIDGSDIPNVVYVDTRPTTIPNSPFTPPGRHKITPPLEGCGWEELLSYDISLDAMFLLRYSAGMYKSDGPLSVVARSSTAGSNKTLDPGNPVLQSPDTPRYRRDGDHIGYGKHSVPVPAVRQWVSHAQLTVPLVFSNIYDRDIVPGDDNEPASQFVRVICRGRDLENITFASRLDPTGVQSRVLGEVAIDGLLHHIEMVEHDGFGANVEFTKFPALRDDLESVPSENPDAFYVITLRYHMPPNTSRDEVDVITLIGHEGARFCAYWTQFGKNGGFGYSSGITQPEAQPGRLTLADSPVLTDDLGSGLSLLDPTSIAFTTPDGMDGVITTPIDPTGANLPSGVTSFSVTSVMDSASTSNEISVLELDIDTESLGLVAGSEVTVSYEMLLEGGIAAELREVGESTVLEEYDGGNDPIDVRNWGPVFAEYAPSAAAVTVVTTRPNETTDHDTAFQIPEQAIGRTTVSVGSAVERQSTGGLEFNNADNVTLSDVTTDGFLGDLGGEVLRLQNPSGGPFAAGGSATIELDAGRSLRWNTLAVDLVTAMNELGGSFPHGVDPSVDDVVLVKVQAVDAPTEALPWDGVSGVQVSQSTRDSAGILLDAVQEAQYLLVRLEFAPFDIDTTSYTPRVSRVTAAGIPARMTLDYRIMPDTFADATDGAPSLKHYRFPVSARDVAGAADGNVYLNRGTYTADLGEGDFHAEAVLSDDVTGEVYGVGHDDFAIETESPDLSLARALLVDAGPYSPVDRYVQVLSDLENTSVASNWNGLIVELEYQHEQGPGTGIWDPLDSVSHSYMIDRLSPTHRDREEHTFPLSSATPPGNYRVLQRVYLPGMSQEIGVPEEAYFEVAALADVKGEFAADPTIIDLGQGGSHHPVDLIAEDITNAGNIALTGFGLQFRISYIPADAAPVPIASIPVNGDELKLEERFTSVWPYTLPVNANAGDYEVILEAKADELVGDSGSVGDWRELDRGWFSVQQSPVSDKFLAVELAAAEGYQSSVAYGVNRRGDVVGTSHAGLLGQQNDDHAVLWPAFCPFPLVLHESEVSGSLNLWTLLDDPNTSGMMTSEDFRSVAIDINDQRLIAGTVESLIDDPASSPLSLSRAIGFLADVSTESVWGLIPDDAVDSDPATYGHSRISGLNDLGMLSSVVGQVIHPTPNGQSLASFWSEVPTSTEPYLSSQSWHPGPGDANDVIGATLLSINNNNDAVGWTQNFDDGNDATPLSSPLARTNGIWQRINLPSSPARFEFHANNNEGEILAAVEMAAGVQTWVFGSQGLNASVAWTSLSDVTPGTNTAVSMNRFPTIVGSYESTIDSAKRGVVSRGIETFVQADALIYNADGFGWSIRELYDVNDSGIVVGSAETYTDPATDTTVHSTAVLLDPINLPEDVLPDISVWLRADIGVELFASVDPMPPADTKHSVLHWIPANVTDPLQHASRQTISGDVFVAVENCCERPYLSFGSADGGNAGSLEQTLELPIGNTFTASTVIRPRQTGAVDQAEPILELLDGTTPVFILSVRNGALELAWTDGGTPRLAPLGLILESDDALLTFVHDDGGPGPDRVTVYRDGVLAFETDAAVGAIDLDGIRFTAPEGALQGTSALDVAELLLFDTALNDDDLARVDRYMVDRYGLDIDRTLRNGTLYVRADRARKAKVDAPSLLSQWINIGIGWNDLTAEVDNEPSISSEATFGCRPGIRFNDNRLGSVPTDYIVIMDRSRSMFRFGPYNNVCEPDDEILFNAGVPNRGRFQFENAGCGDDIFTNVFDVKDANLLWDPNGDGMLQADTRYDYYWTRAGAAVEAIMNLADLALGPANSAYGDVQLGLAFFGADLDSATSVYTSYVFPPVSKDGVAPLPATHFLSPTPDLTEGDEYSSIHRMLQALQLNEAPNSSQPGSNSRYKYGFVRALNSMRPHRRTEIVFMGHGLPRESPMSGNGAGDHQTLERLFDELNEPDFTEINPLIGAGDETTSILALAREYDVRVHTLGFALDMIDIDSDREGAEQILRALAEWTGGEYYPAFTLEEITSSFTDLLADDIAKPYEGTIHLVFEADGTAGSIDRQLVWFSGDRLLGTSAWIDRSDASLESEGRAMLHVEYWNRPADNVILTGSTRAALSGEIDLDRPYHLLVSVAAAGTGADRQLRALVNGVPLSVTPGAAIDATIESPQVAVGPFDLGGSARDLVMDGQNATGIGASPDFQGLVGYIGELAILPRLLSIDEQNQLFRHVDRDYEIIVPVQLPPVARAEYVTSLTPISVSTFAMLPPLQPQERQVEFNGEDSTDPNVEQIPELDYAWFIDDDLFQTGQRVTTTESSFEPGSYVATLHVTDPDGLTDTDSVEFTILGTATGIQLSGFGGSAGPFGRGSGPTAVDGKLGAGATIGSLPAFDLFGLIPSPPRESVARTIAFWANPAELSSSPEVFYLQEGDTEDERLEIAMNSDLLRIRIGERVFGIDDSGVGGFGAGWHHVALVVPENSVWSDELALYLNGVRRNLITLGGTGLAEPLRTGATSLLLGDTKAGGSPAAMDEFMLAAVPFTQQQVLQLAARSSSVHWRFNEGSGTSVNDAAGGGDPTTGLCGADGWNSGVATASGVSLALDTPVTSSKDVSLPLGSQTWTIVARFQSPDAPRTLLSDSSGPVVTVSQGDVSVRLTNGGQAHFPLAPLGDHWYELILSSSEELDQLACWTSTDSAATALGAASIDGEIVVGSDTDPSWPGTVTGAVDTFAIIGAPVFTPDDDLLHALQEIAADQY
ncbi:MAG: hypothetical protein AAFZ67_14205 [Planctomycetota bacterium]